MKIILNNSNIEIRERKHYYSGDDLSTAGTYMFNCEKIAHSSGLTFFQAQAAGSYKVAKVYSLDYNSLVGKQVRLEMDNAPQADEIDALIVSDTPMVSVGTRVDASFVPYSFTNFESLGGGKYGMNITIPSGYAYIYFANYVELLPQRPSNVNYDAHLIAMENI